MKVHPILVGFLLILYSSVFISSAAHAENFTDSGFESKMQNLQNKFINVILPLMSILGLVYAGILAASGNEGAKGKIVVIIIGSIIGFLAPHIIGWIKGILT